MTWLARNAVGEIKAIFGNVYDCSNFCDEYNKKNNLNYDVHIAIHDRKEHERRKKYHLWPYTEDGRKANSFDF